MTNPATKSVDAYLERQRAYWGPEPIREALDRLNAYAAAKAEAEKAKADLREAEERRDMKAWGG